MNKKYLAEYIPEEYRNPQENVWLVPCWDSYYNIEVIEIPDDWPWPLPELPAPLADPPSDWIPFDSFMYG